MYQPHIALLGSAAKRICLPRRLPARREGTESPVTFPCLCFGFSLTEQGFNDPHLVLREGKGHIYNWQTNSHISLARESYPACKPL